MSVYKQAYATPSRILGIYRYLLHARGQRVARDELEELLMPEHLPLKDVPPSGGEIDAEPEAKKDAPKRDMAKRSIDEAITMRLIAADKDILLLHPDLPEGARSPSTGEGLLPRTLTALLLSPGNPANHDLARAIAWYLAQDIYEPPGSWQEIQQKHADEAKALEMVDTARFHQFVYWARFLGFVWTHAAPERAAQRTKLALVPDPFRPIRWAAGALFAEQHLPTLPLTALVANLATSLPVLEEGAFRHALEGNVIPVREEHQLSVATAHAWLRLQDEGTVKLVNRSDGVAYRFPHGDGEFRFTEVTWQAGD